MESIKAETGVRKCKGGGGDESRKGWQIRTFNMRTREKHAFGSVPKDNSIGEHG